MAGKQPIAGVELVGHLLNLEGGPVDFLNEAAKPALAIAEGYHEPADGGGGTFRWVPDAIPGDGGTIIPVANGNGTWVRAYSGPLNVLWFGAKPNRRPGEQETSGPALLAAIDATKKLAKGNDAFSERGATLYFSAGQYLVETEPSERAATIRGLQPQTSWAAVWNFDGTYGIRLEGESCLSGPGSPQSAAVVFKTSGQAIQPPVHLISAIWASHFQLHRLEIAYDNSAFAGTLVANRSEVVLDGTGVNTALGQFESCTFTGADDLADGAACLLDISQSIDVVVRDCVFKVAQTGINGTSAYVVSIENCIFMSIASGAGIRNVGDQWLVKSCTFEYASHLRAGSPWQGQSVGIYSERGSSGQLTVQNCWFGDGAGGRPRIITGDLTQLNVIGCLIVGGADEPLISIDGGTTHNVNLTGNTFSSFNNVTDHGSPVHIADTAAVVSILACGNRHLRFTAVPFLTQVPGGSVQNLTVIETAPDEYPGNALFNRGIRTFDNAVVDGSVVPVPFLPRPNEPNASVHFGAWPQRDWSVDANGQRTLRYSLSGHVMTITFEVDHTAVSGSPAALVINLPNGRLGDGNVFTDTFQYRDNGVGEPWQVGAAISRGGGYAELHVYPSDDANPWPPSPDFEVRGVAVVPVL